MESKVELTGSHRPEPEGAMILRDADANTKTSVTVHLKTPLPEASGPVSRAELAMERVSEYEAAAEAFRRFAIQHRLALRRDPARGCLHLEAALEPMARAFGTSLRIYDDGRRRFRARSGALLVPEELASWTLAVLGLDHRPVVKQRLANAGDAGEGPGLWPTEVARLYGLSPEMDAPGECVGIIALGGGYLPSDLAFAADGMNRPVPLVIDFAVGGVTNTFGGGDSADEEVALDLQILAMLVPSARVVVYFAANTTQSLADAIRQAVFDDVNRPHVLSISWGSAEKFWTESARAAVHSALADAARLGVSVVVSVGDLLATGGLADGAAHVLFPASSPFALACGGTQLALASDGSALERETVWNASLIGTGGGISDTFPVPDYQQNVTLPKSVNDGGRRRGVPDVSAAAAQSPGYRIVLNGRSQVMQGTSATAPLWAALIAMANAQRGTPAGLIHPFLYSTPSLCRPITEGDNRSNGIGYEAGQGWNACAGFGVPIGDDTVNALAAIPLN